MLGTPLFTRSSGGLTATEAALALREHAEAMGMAADAFVRAGSAGGNITAVDTSEEDIISITGVNDLDTQIQNITFTNNGGYEGTPIDGKTVDATINFVNGGSITFADFLDSGTDVSSLLPNSGSLTSNSEVSDDTVIEGADEVITVTGISAVDLNTAFGGSFQVA